MKFQSSFRTSTLALIIVVTTIAAFLAWRQYAMPTGTQVAPTLVDSIERVARPIVVVTMDTTRVDRLEPYGVENVATPALAELAASGVVFENARAVSPITLVSHASILSGKYPFEHGIRNNGIHYAAPELETLPEVLSEQGYRTAAFVSAAVLDKRYGLNQGFDVYDDDLSTRRNTSPRMVADRPAENTVDAAIEWLETVPEGDNYFLWVHLYDPHATYSPPPPYRDDYRDRLYDGEIAYMDEHIGRLLAHPRLSGQAGPAPVVAVLADHGESLGEHGERTHAILAYDSTLHIPFIMRVPGGPEGLRVKDSVGQVDLMPTLLSLVGVPYAPQGTEHLTARDLSPLLLQPDAVTAQAYYSETYLPYYTYGWEKLRVLQRGRWKYISAPDSELYDLVRDPRELTNLLEQETGLSHDFARDLDEWVVAGDGEQDASLTLDSEEKSKLRSLGYLSIGSGQNHREGPRPNPMLMIHDHVDMEHARALLGDRLYSQAETKLDGVLERDPGNLAALIEMVRAREGLGNLEGAIEVAEQALALDTDYVQTYLTLARLEAQRGEFEKSLELVELAHSKDGGQASTGALEITYLRRLRRLDEAQQALEDLLVAYPDDPQVLVLYAHTLEVPRGDYESAEKKLRQAYEINPYMEQVGLYLGLLLERTGRGAEAQETYLASLRNSPDSAALHGALGQLLARMGELVEAESHLREAIRLDRNPRSEIYVALGGVLAEQGQPKAALKQYQKVLDSNPRHPGARNNAAIALYRTGQVNAAYAALTELVKDFPNHVDANNNLAAIAIDRGDWEAVVRHAQKTLDLAPEVVEAWNNLAVGNEELGRFDEARKGYERALELAPGYWQARHNLGQLLVKMDEDEAAEEVFNAVLVDQPAFPGAHLALAELYAGPLAQPQRAKVHWNAVLRHAPNHPSRQQILDKLSEI